MHLCTNAYGAAQTAEETQASPPPLKWHRVPREDVLLAAYRIHIQDVVVTLFLALCVGGSAAGGATMIIFNHVTHAYEGKGDAKPRDCTFL